MSGDYFHYEYLYDLNVKFNERVHIEQLYFWLINILPESYSLWRAVVWGSAIIIWIKLNKRLGFQSQYAGIVITLILLAYFPNMRQSLGFAIMFYSISFIFIQYRNSKIISLLLCLLGLSICPMLHKSMLMYVFLTIFAFLPFSRKTIRITLLIFPLLYGVTSVLATHLLMNSGLFDETTQNFGNMYLEVGKNELTAWGYLQTLVIRIPILFSIGFLIRKVFYQKSSRFSSIGLYFIKISYIYCYIGCLFWGQNVSSFLSARFLDACYYPLSLAVTCYITHNLTNSDYKILKLILYLFLISNVYMFAYTIYKIL